MSRFIVLLEKVTEEDESQVVIRGVSTVAEAIAEAKRMTGQSVIEVEEDFLDVEEI